VCTRTTGRTIDGLHISLTMSTPSAKDGRRRTHAPTKMAASRSTAAPTATAGKNSSTIPWFIRRLSAVCLIMEFVRKPIVPITTRGKSADSHKVPVRCSSDTSPGIEEWHLTKFHCTKSNLWKLCFVTPQDPNKSNNISVKATNTLNSQCMDVGRSHFPWSIPELCWSTKRQSCHMCRFGERLAAKI